jgi:AraC-like DNA-binding protein
VKKGTERIFRNHGLTVYHQNFPKKQLQEHSHDEAHLLIPLGGSLELDVDGITYVVKAGQMMFVGGSVEHTFRAKGESGERLILQLDKFKYKSKISILPLHELLKELIMSLFSYKEEHFCESIVKLLTEILSDLLNNQKLHSKNELFITQQKILTSQNEQLKKILTVLEEDLEISMPEVAEKCGVSPRTLGRITKDETGLSPNELHTYYRIQKASELIFEGRLGLTAIAFECGYSSLSQFIQNYKNWTGSKPSETVRAAIKPFQ